MTKPRLVKIQIQLPEDIRTHFKAKCVLEGTSMNDVIIELIKGWTEGKTREEKT